MEHDDGRSHRIAGQGLRLLAVHGDAPRAGLEEHALLADQMRFADGGSESRVRSPVPDHLHAALGTEAPTGRQDVEGLEEARLALSVVPEEDVAAPDWLVLHGLEIAEIAEPHGLQADPGGQMRN